MTTENLNWPDQNEVTAQLEAILKLAKELRTDYPTDTPDGPTNWSNEARSRRNTLIRAQFSTDETAFNLINGAEWLELFDLLGFSVDKETRKRFASHLNYYSFWYADFKPRLSSKYAQRIHWYVHNFLFCLRGKLQTEKDYREGKYSSKGQAYFMEIEQQPATPTVIPQISTGTVEAANISSEEGKEDETARNRYSDTRIVMDEFGHKYEVTRRWENGKVNSLDVIDLTAPQPPETARTVDYAAPTAKAREAAGNRPKSPLGSQGNMMLDDASATMAAAYGRY